VNGGLILCPTPKNIEFLGGSCICKKVDIQGICPPLVYNRLKKDMTLDGKGIPFEFVQAEDLLKCTHFLQNTIYCGPLYRKNHYI